MKIRKRKVRKSRRMKRNPESEVWKEWFGAKLRSGAKPDVTVEDNEWAEYLQWASAAQTDFTSFKNSYENDWDIPDDKPNDVNWSDLKWATFQEWLNESPAEPEDDVVEDIFDTPPPQQDAQEEDIFGTPPPQQDAQEEDIFGTPPPQQDAQEEEKEEEEEEDIFGDIFKASPGAAQQDAPDDDDVDAARKNQIRRIWAESEQKREFYKTQKVKSKYMERFKDFVQFLPSKKSDVFRTLPLPKVEDFGFIIDKWITDGTLEGKIGKSVETNEIGAWPYLTSQYGNPKGIGTIIVYVRRNQHTQLFIPSMTPNQKQVAGPNNEVLNFKYWSPSAEFISRPDIAWWGANLDSTLKKIKTSPDKKEEGLSNKLSEYYLKRNFGSYPQMMKFVQIWRMEKANSLQRRSVMPVLVFVENSQGVPQFQKLFRSSGLNRDLAMNVEQMMQQGDQEEQFTDRTFTEDSLAEDIRKFVQMFGDQARNNPLFKQRIHKRVNKRRRRK